jgi:uncharacterized membrane protein
VPALPPWVPWPALWAVVTGVVLIALGGALLVGRGTRPAAYGLAAMLLLSFLVQRVPEIAANPGVGFIWTNPAKVLALAGGALMLAAVPRGAELSRAGRLSFLGPWLLGVFLVICGVQHFVYAGFVDTLVPPWLPPGQRFWTYFAGLALVAGGVGLVVPRTARWAALASGVMIFLWVPLVHIPRSLEFKSAFELAGVLEALALSGVAFLAATVTRPAGRRP